MPPLSARRPTEAAIARMYKARHRLRRAVVYATLREGMTIDAIAATLEVSAHMVCAIAAETPFRPDCPGGLGEDASSACRRGRRPLHLLTGGSGAGRPPCPG